MRSPPKLQESDFILVSQKQVEDNIFNTSSDQQTDNKMAHSHKPVA